jgi:hypothetical protein
MHQISQEMRACIDECLRCYQTCLGTAMTHCLEQGGKHTEPEHFRLMMACFEICRTAAHFMLIGTPHHKHTCRERGDLRGMRQGLRAGRRHAGMRGRLPSLRRELPQDGGLTGIGPASSHIA